MLAAMIIILFLSLWIFGLSIIVYGDKKRLKLELENSKGNLRDDKNYE